jgi:hypothetical protein
MWLKWIAYGCLTLIVSALILSAIGSWRWQAANAALLRQLEMGQLVSATPRYHASSLENLPAPVQRYFQVALTDGQRIITGAAITHRGEFNMSATAAQWKPFRSTQRVIVHRPGFVWNASIAMSAGLSVRVHDAYIGGHGVLRGAMMGLFPVVDMADTPALAQGEPAAAPVLPAYGNHPRAAWLLA